MLDLYSVNITERALSDLETIFDHISQDSPQNAQRMIRRIIRAIHHLEFMPVRSRIVRRSKKRGSTIHVRIVRPFMIYYRIDEPTLTVFVVEVRHGARQQPKRFK